MRKLRFPTHWFVLAPILLWSFAGCGGHRPVGSSPVPVRVNLVPSPTTSVQLGNVIVFTASAQNAAGTSVRSTLSFTSSDTSILNISPTGAACAGHWDTFYQICTPGNIGVVQVTAIASPASSASTLVYVHPPIDNIIVKGISLTGLPVQEPCLSQSQSMTVQAYAYSQGNDITSSVGPFTWSANNANVVKLTPFTTNVVYPNFTYNVATNQATALAVTPGVTEIYASADGTTSTEFLQPGVNNPQNQSAPALDFFATCPIQDIVLEVGHAGSGQTSFVASKTSSGSTSTQIVATVTDLAGNTSLPSSDGAIILSKIPLTWTSTQPQVASLAATTTTTTAATSTCTLSCILTFPSTGAIAVNASCSPPTCNIGFPFVPPSLSTPALVDACTAFFAPLFPSNPNFNCQLLIPVPTYPSPLTATTPSSAISGLVTGATAAAVMVAGTLDCADITPPTCITAFYSITTAKAVPGLPNLSGSPANSLVFDLIGDKAYMGSDFGAVTVSPGSFGSATSPFTPLSPVIGVALAASPKGDMGIFSDTLHTPNQVYVTNTAASTVTYVAENISSASVAAFSPDELKAFIYGLDPSGNPNLFVFSPLQSLQTIPLAAGTAVDAIAFSNNGSFSYVAESLNGAGNLTAYNTCNNQVASNNQTPPVPANLALPAAPIAMKVLPSPQLSGTDSLGNPIPNGEHILLLDSTGIDIVTSNVVPPSPGAVCPQPLTFSPLQRIELNQGTITPLNFFVSADGTLLYLVATDRYNIFTYNFNASAWSGGIQLQNNATPLAATVSTDAGLILIAGSDGTLHQVTTGLNGFDFVPFPLFPNLPNYQNPFCNYTPASGPCTFDLLVVK